MPHTTGQTRGAGRVHPRALVGAVALVSALMLAGCTASGGAAAEGSKPAPSASAAGSQSQLGAEGGTEAGAVTDAQTCAAISDVLTILFNAEAAARDGRMQIQEQQSWDRLAARIMDRAPLSGETALSQTVADLQESILDTSPGALGTTLTGTDAWGAALPTIREQCIQAGAELVTEGFVGG